MSSQSLYGILKKDYCTLNNVKSSLRRFYIGIPIIVLVHSVLYVGIGNEVVLDVFKFLLPNIVKGPLIPTNAYIAGINEPPFSKLFPILLLFVGGSLAFVSYTFAVILSIILFGMYAVDPRNALAIGGFAGLGLFLLIRYRLNWRSFNCLPTRKHRWTAGALTGLSFGVVEAYIKVFQEDSVILPFLWEYPSFDPVILPPIFLHIFEGTLVVGTFLLVARNRRYEWWEKVVRVVGALLIAMGVHVYWNTRFALTVRGDCVGSWCFWDWWTVNYTPELFGFVLLLLGFVVWFLYTLDGVETTEVSV
jgi:hypothetical protein